MTTEAKITPADRERFFDAQGDELCERLATAERAAVDAHIEPIFRTPPPTRDRSKDEWPVYTF